jgi:hypothetical protein
LPSKFPVSSLFCKFIQKLFTSPFSSSHHFYSSVYLFVCTVILRAFPRSMWTIHLAFLLFIVFRKFISSLTLCNTSFLTMIFSILLHHHISKRTKYFWSTFRRTKRSPPHKILFQISTLPVSSLNLFIFLFKHSLSWKF